MSKFGSSATASSSIVCECGHVRHEKELCENCGFVPRDYYELEKDNPTLARKFVDGTLSNTSHHSRTAYLEKILLIRCGHYPIQPVELENEVEEKRRRYKGETPPILSMELITRYWKEWCRKYSMPQDHYQKTILYFNQFNKVQLGPLHTVFTGVFEVIIAPWLDGDECTKNTRKRTHTNMRHAPGLIAFVSYQISRVVKRESNEYKACMLVIRRCGVHKVNPIHHYFITSYLPRLVKYQNRNQRLGMYQHFGPEYNQRWDMARFTTYYN